MTDALRMDIGKGAEELVDVYLDLEDGHRRLHFVEETRGAVHSLRHELKDEVEVDFVFLRQASATPLVVPRAVFRFNKILSCLHALHSSSRTL